MKKSSLLIISVIVLAVILACGCTQSPAGNATAPAGQNPAAAPTSATLQPAAVIMDTGTSAVANPGQSMVRGTPDPAFFVNISVDGKIAPGTTILADNHDPKNPRIIEVNRLGEIVWEYRLSDDLKPFTNPGWDVEVLKNGNVLTLLPGYGVLEINRDKKIVWKYLDPKVSHDADRLSSGNTLVVFGSKDTKDDAQVKEIDPSGKVVWSWYAKYLFNTADYTNIWDEGWTHTNAVTRLENGNTLISLRNFNIVAEIDPNGKLVRKIGEGFFVAQHDPQVLENGKILVANHVRPNEVMEYNPSGSVSWKFVIPDRSAFPIRDANKLANGNILITGADRIIEVTPDKQVVWLFRLADAPFTDERVAESRGFYKAERISP
nr:aryl-sulfate sulfotransferase [uncultured Methanoregula sp.]